MSDRITLANELEEWAENASSWSKRPHRVVLLEAAAILRATSDDPQRGRAMTDAVDMAAMRLQAQALVFQWLAARDFQLPATAEAVFYVYPAEFCLQPQVLDGDCVAIRLTVEKKP